MRILIAADHAGLDSVEPIQIHLINGGHTVEVSAPPRNETVDYPDYAGPAARRVAAGEFDCGVFICGTGQGMAIAANKVPGIRASCPYDEYTARMSRSHNDANVICLGGRSMAVDRSIQILEKWLATSFEGGRHSRRLEKIRKLEER